MATTNPATRPDPNILALLYSKLRGSGGSLAEFAPGAGGVDPNLGAALVALGYAPRHQDMSGRYMLPGERQGGPGGLDGQTFRGLDALHAMQRNASGGDRPNGAAIAPVGRVGPDRIEQWSAGGPPLPGGAQGPTRQLLPVNMNPTPADTRPGGGMAPYQPPVAQSPQSPSLPDYRRMFPSMFSPSNRDTYAQIAGMPNRPQAPMPTGEYPSGPQPTSRPPIPGFLARPQLGALEQGPSMSMLPPSPFPSQMTGQMPGASIGGGIARQEQLEQSVRDRITQHEIERNQNPGWLYDMGKALTPSYEKRKKPLKSPLDFFQPLLGQEKKAYPVKR